MLGLGVDARETLASEVVPPPANDDEDVELWREGELEFPLIFSLQFVISPLGVLVFTFFLYCP